MALSTREAAIVEAEEKASYAVEFWFNGELLTSHPRHTGTTVEREMLINFCERTGGVPLVSADDLKGLGRLQRGRKVEIPKCSWRNTAGWNRDTAPKWHHEYLCCYHGVTLSREDGRVIKLELRANGLVNALPQRMLRELSALQVLDLSDNE
jgi:hypothetical protein